MNVEVHIDWRSKTHFVGLLYPVEKGPSVSFEYAREWVDNPMAFAIDPTALPLQRTAFHSPLLFGALQDCGPDRWGRVLIERAVRKKVLEQKPYRDIDYTLALDDFSRIGALRFRTVPDGPFLAASSGLIPPIIRLGALVRATDSIHNETETAKDLQFLLGAGSPLGGARPKSAVQLPDGSMGIAKFPKPDDTRDIEAGEILALQLARECRINVADHRLINVGGRSVVVVTRFDRIVGQRIPFISAATLLALRPGATGAYSLLADGIRQFGHKVTSDLSELWRRLVFSLLVSNYDDHLRNHALLMAEPGRWSLSPAYDLNPVPEIDRARTTKTAITEDQEALSIDAAMVAAPRFGLKAKEAKAILREVVDGVSKWKKTGQRLRIKASTMDAYASAFEHPMMVEAKAILTA
jgi:serine/threonine-protein kinase HipA